MSHKTLYVFGVTCVGKDFFIEAAVAMHPRIFGQVQVGKELRKRHPPEHFKGLGAPTHTEDEALDIFREQHAAEVAAGKKIILVSGQPRRMNQVPKVMAYAPGEVLWLFADESVIMGRLDGRFVGNEAGRQLSLDRLTNDRVQLYDTLFTLVSDGYSIRTLDTRERDIFKEIDSLAREASSERHAA